MEVSQKKKSTIWSHNASFGCVSKSTKPRHERDVSCLVFTEGLFQIAKREVPSVLIKKMWFLYTVEYYLALKQKDMLSHAAKWMNLKEVMLSEML